jgi:hypothetical protein
MGGKIQNGYYHQPAGPERVSLWGNSVPRDPSESGSVSATKRQSSELGLADEMLRPA